MLPEPVFFDTDEQVIVSDMVAYYEGAVGKKLSPSQTEQLLINTFAYREKLLRIQGNEAAKQNLLAYATFPVLDYLGEWLGVVRLPASNSQCTMSFSLVTGHGPLVIPAGTRVQSSDGKAVFITTLDVIAQAGDATVTVTAQCTVAGSIGENYNPGDIAIILDPVAFVGAAANTNKTSGGNDQEGDEALRERIQLAPSSFSTAGPEDAYIYFAKSAHPSIIDVKVDSPTPGTVAIYPLIEGGIQPSQTIIDAVQAKCSPKKTRPLNDIVTVVAPSNVDYSLVINLVLLKSAITSVVVDDVRAKSQAYTLQRQTNLGIDVIINQIVAQCCNNTGIYKPTVASPSADMTVNLNQFANCLGITVNVTGLSDS